jgi:pantoate--beta-alanine ligase
MEHMIVAEHVRDRCSLWRADGARIGLVPTMGAFHEGHLSLIRRARAECDRVVVYLFVNPLQFGVGEDFAMYPKDVARDEVLAESLEADLFFTPTLEDMYPQGYPPSPTDVIHAGPPGEILEGKARPGHFDGVLTVVHRLFSIAGACRAYLGEKDAQQLFLIRQLAEARFPGVEVVPCPTVREPDGLAMSSRNTYLSPEERVAAASLSEGLFSAERLFASGERDGAALVAAMLAPVLEHPSVQADYATVVDADTFEAVTAVTGPALALVAAHVGRTRLIDNVRLI